MNSASLKEIQSLEINTATHSWNSGTPHEETNASPPHQRANFRGCHEISFSPPAHWTNHKFYFGDP